MHRFFGRFFDDQSSSSSTTNNTSTTNTLPDPATSLEKDALFQLNVGGLKVVLGRVNSRPPSLPKQKPVILPAEQQQPINTETILPALLEMFSSQNPIIQVLQRIGFIKFSGLFLSVFKITFQEAQISIIDLEVKYNNDDDGSNKSNVDDSSKNGSTNTKNKVSY